MGYYTSNRIDRMWYISLLLDGTRQISSDGYGVVCLGSH